MFQLSKLRDDYHLIIIATFWISETGLATINEMSLMAVNENWIPFENIYEDHLLQQLAQLRRKSIKGLRFNLAVDRPIVAATLERFGGDQTALYVVPPSADETYERTLAELIEAHNDIPAWTWRPAQEDMPPLP